MLPRVVFFGHCPLTIPSPSPSSSCSCLSLSPFANNFKFSLHRRFLPHQLANRLQISTPCDTNLRSAFSILFVSLVCHLGKLNRAPTFCVLVAISVKFAGCNREDLTWFVVFKLPMLIFQKLSQLTCHLETTR